MRNLALLGILLFASSITAPAQTVTDLRFTVASLRPFAAPVSTPAPPGEEIISERVVRTEGAKPIHPGIVSPGRIHYIATLKELLASAFDVKLPQVDGPAWIDSESFVIDATMPPDTNTRQLLSMLQNLLADRFKLTIHRESRELPIYALVVSKGGSKLKQVDQTSPPVTSFRAVAASGRIRFTAQAATLQDLAEHLTLEVDRSVKDQTGMQGRYDYVLAFSSDPLSGSANPAVPSD